MTDYSAKLRDPRWQKTRLEIMQRDGFRCKACDSGRRTLNVHHLFYRRDADTWDYDPGELVTLCEECHERQHADGGPLYDFVEFIRAFLNRGGSLSLLTDMAITLDFELPKGQQLADCDWAAIRSDFRRSVRAVAAGYGYQFSWRPPTERVEE